MPPQSGSQRSCGEQAGDERRSGYRSRAIKCRLVRENRLLTRAAHKRNACTAVTYRAAEGAAPSHFLSGLGQRPRRLIGGNSRLLGWLQLHAARRWASPQSPDA